MEGLFGEGLVLFCCGDKRKIGRRGSQSHFYALNDSPERGHRLGRGEIRCYILRRLLPNEIGYCALP